MASEVIRSCIVCRERAEKSELLRFVGERSGAVADLLQVKPGRGVYLHPKERCLTHPKLGGVLRKALSLSGAAEVAVVEQLAVALHALEIAPGSQRSIKAMRTKECVASVLDSLQKASHSGTNIRMGFRKR